MENNEPDRIFGLDVMRAIAILIVVCDHGKDLIPYEFPNLARFGFDGVTMFFVLSGYLIGTILIRDFQTNGCQLKTIISFWSRRWLRTLPAYVCILTILIISTLALHRGLPSKIYLYYVFSQNIAWAHPGFFPEAWSLSIEEWFYLTIPLIIFLACKIFRQSLQHATLTTIVLVIVIATTLRFVRLSVGDIQTIGDWDIALRKIVITRLDSLMFGVLGAYLSVFAGHLWTAFRWPLLLLGISMLLVNRTMALNISFWRDYVTLTSSPIASLLLLPFLSTWNNCPHRLLKFVTFFSFISYSLYLVHFSLVKNFVLPLYVKNLPQSFSPAVMIYVLYWLISIALAYLSWRYIEKPFLMLRDQPLRW